MLWVPEHHKRIVQLADFITVFVSFVSAYYFWIYLRMTFPDMVPGGEMHLDDSYLLLVIFLSFIWVILFDKQGAYSYQRFTSYMTEFKIILKTGILGSLILTGMMFLLRPGYIARGLVLLFLPINLLFLIIEKIILFQLAQVVRKQGENRKAVLIAGTEGQTKRFVQAIENNSNWGLDIIGFLGPNEENVGKELFGKKILGTYEDIVPVLHRQPVDEVIITVSTQKIGEISGIIEACEREGVQVRIISDFLGRIAKRFRADTIYGLPIISISYIPDNSAALTVKRLIDILFSSLGLLAVSPLFLIIAIAVKVSSPGPVFYQWNVVGHNKKPFRSWKFRTMVVGADAMKAQLAHLNEMKGPVFKIASDPRVTPLGRILRKCSLDELPQLWSVLKGDMSLIGPRPAGPHELVHYESWQRRRLSFKPGLSCLWAVNGRNQISDFNDWVKLDLEYIDNWSLWLDMKIIFKTVYVVISGRGAH